MDKDTVTCKFFEKLEAKAGGRDDFLKEASKLGSFLDWNVLIYGDEGRYDILKDPALLLFLSNGYDKLAVHFDKTSKAYKSYDASAADLMEWIASEKEVNITDFEDWTLEGWRPAKGFMQIRFMKEFEEDDGK